MAGYLSKQILTSPNIQFQYAHLAIKRNIVICPSVISEEVLDEPT